MKVAAPRQSPQFLTIALELREIVYKHLLRDAPSSLTDLLVSNRQLSTEVLPFQFRRHLTFNGQGELFDWLDDVDHQYLRLVADVSFKLYDIDPQTIVGALGKRLRQANVASKKGSHTAGQSDNPYNEACDAEMRKLSEAFKLLPNLRKLTIGTTDAGDPQPPQRMLSTFSKILAHRFRHLHTLISYEDALPLDFLSNKPNLRRLRFPAISPGSNADVAGILSTLPPIDLEIYRLPHHTPPAPLKRRILAQVLRSVSPLRSLMIYEDEPEEEPDEPDLIYEAFVHAKDALARHKPTLRRFAFNADVAGGDVEDFEEEWMVESRTALKRFLREAVSQRVHVVGLDPDTWDDRDAP